MLHIKRYLTALAAFLVLYSAYALAVAPWVAPPPLVRAAVTGQAREAASPPTPLRPEWEGLFAADAWERKNPKVVETERCTLLIQDYRTTAEGHLELSPCTLVFHSASALAQQSAKSPAETARPIVLQAPKAELVFDKPLDLARATFGRVEKGTLSGEIRIFSPPSSPAANDALEVRTRAVWLDKEAIRTANDVEFRYGESSGRGRDLEISLLARSEEAAQAAKSKLMGVHSLTLRRLDFLRLVVPEGGVLPGPPKSARRGPVGPPGPTGPPEPISPPLEITCAGEFAFDVQAQVARFQERVRVSRTAAPGIPPDSLQCDELLLTLGGGTQPAVGGAQASSSDPLAGRLQRIIALGRPAVLEVPARGIRAQAAYMEYSLAENSVQLKADPAQNLRTVSLTQFDQHCIAPELHYKLPEEGRLGRLHAGGPGELRLLQGRGPAKHFITARWERTLEMRPQEGNHVISLQGAAAVTMDPLGQFMANDMHLWVVEAPAPAATDAGAAPPSAETTVLPDRLLAVGKVHLNSPQLDVETSRLEAWFLNLPPEPSEPPQPRRFEGPIREPVARVSHQQAAAPQATIHDSLGEATLQRFRVAGGVIRTQLVLRGSKFDLEDLNIRGQAEIDETRTPEPGLMPLKLRGEVLEIRHGTRPQATMQVTGAPAEIAGRGMSLAGGRIDLYRAANELRIDGAGEATCPAGGMGGGAGLLPGLNGPASGAKSADKLHILWNNGLVFDGLTAVFRGDVILRTDTQTARAPTLAATLNRRLDFGPLMGGGQRPAAAPPLELARAVLDGEASGVYIESQAFDELGEQQARDQGQVRNIAVDFLGGSLLAEGPGWVSTVRRSGSLRPPGAVQEPAAPAIAPAGAPAARGAGLTSIHVAFEREIAGDLNQRWIEFRQQVLTTYSPANDFGDILAADPLAPLDERMMLMRSEALRITDMSQNGQQAIELEARGQTKVEAKNLVVDAPIVQYSSGKEALTIKGDGRATAKVFSTRPGQEGTYEGQQFTYNVKTGDLQIDVGRMQFNVPRQLPLRMPGPGMRQQ